MPGRDKVIIVGGGLAGLCCALQLHRDKIPFLILEGSNAVGGRVRTDLHEGFLLDRGFQIFLTAYPEAQAVLNYEKLQLKPFYPGSIVWKSGQFHKMADPFRKPIDALISLFNPVGNVHDKFAVAGLRQDILDDSNDDTKCDTGDTLSMLKQRGFSDEMIKSFFRPLFAGIFLENKLETSNEVFNFVFKMLAKGDNVLPSAGMQAIPAQIAQQLPAENICLLHKVARVDGNSVKMNTGEVFEGKAVVIATEEPECRRLLGLAENISYRSQTCLYFSADEAPFDEPVIALNGESSGIVTNFAVVSNVSPNYAPPGKVLLNAVITGDSKMDDNQLEATVRDQLKSWFGTQVNDWKHLRTYRVKYSLPDQTQEARLRVDRSSRCGNSLYYCGDYLENGSINGAMKSGRKVAELVKSEIFSLAK